MPTVAPTPVTALPVTAPQCAPAPFSLSLDDVVRAPELGLHIVVGSPHALGLSVSWAHATEMIDPRPHLRRSELVCTVGSALNEVEHFARFVAAVEASSSAGICFGIGEMHLDAPPALIAECRRLSVPLITMAHGIPFLAINDFLMAARIRGQQQASQTVGAQASGRKRVGQLVTLVADGLAGPAALLPDLTTASLGAQVITVSAWPPGSAERLAEVLPDALIADAPEATFIFSPGSAAIHDAARYLELVCGLGSPVSLAQIRRALTEAKATLVIANARAKVTGPEGLTDLTGLLQQQPPRLLAPFVDQLIRPLLDHDAHKATQLLATLRMFLQHTGSLQKTAESHFLHVNTVRHRLSRISQITGRNPLDHHGQISLAIALWAYDSSGPGHPESPEKL